MDSDAARETVVIPYSRHFPYDLPRAFAWLTDYQDDDHVRAQQQVIQKRIVTERTEARVVVDVNLNIMGTGGQGKAEILLFPPDRWEAKRITKSGRPSDHYFYKLTPEANGVRLDVQYHIRVRKPMRRFLIRATKPIIVRQLDKMWANFAASMARDLAPG